jgi:hypothetical protein
MLLRLVFTIPPINRKLALKHFFHPHPIEFNFVRNAGLGVLFKVFKAMFSVQVVS